MKPGYQLEPVIKKAMKFFLSLFEHRIELSIFKKKEKIKRRKLLIQVNIGIHSILSFFKISFSTRIIWEIFIQVHESEFLTQMTLFHRSDIFSILTAKV